MHTSAKEWEKRWGSNPTPPRRPGSQPDTAARHLLPLRICKSNLPWTLDSGHKTTLPCSIQDLPSHLSACVLPCTAKADGSSACVRNIHNSVCNDTGCFRVSHLTSICRYESPMFLCHVSYPRAGVSCPTQLTKRASSLEKKHMYYSSSYPASADTWKQ